MLKDMAVPCRIASADSSKISELSTSQEMLTSFETPRSSIAESSISLSKGNQAALKRKLRYVNSESQ